MSPDSLGAVAQVVTDTLMWSKRLRRESRRTGGEAKCCFWGESEVTYDAAEHCWKAEVTSPRVKSVWRLFVSGNHLTGTARVLPGNETIRKLDLKRLVR